MRDEGFNLFLFEGFDFLAERLPLLRGAQRREAGMPRPNRLTDSQGFLDRRRVREHVAGLLAVAGVRGEEDLGAGGPEREGGLLAFDRHRPRGGTVPLPPSGRVPFADRQQHLGG